MESIVKLFEDYGEMDYIGEPVTQKEHMIQTAMLAEEEGYTKDIIIGALLHDIGHLVGLHYSKNKMSDFGIHGHENIGAKYLESLDFPEIIVEMVRNHVQTKRYLVFKIPEYYEKLSEASKKTLEYQGGKMSNEEADKFEKHKYFEIFLKLREWDDKAKEKGKHVKTLDYYVNVYLKS